MVKDEHLLAWINDRFDQLREARVFQRTDLKSSFGFKEKFWEVVMEMRDLGVSQNEFSNF